MVQYTTTIKRFGEQGEKTGWTYIEIPADIAQQIKPGNKKVFRVKGKLDSYSIKQVAILPMGGGSFVMPLNAAMRKGIGKRHGAQLQVRLDEDHKQIELNPEFIECLKDEPRALKFFESLAPSHQRYFSKWIESAKTIETKTKRIAYAVDAMSKYKDFGAMVRGLKEEKGR